MDLEDVLCSKVRLKILRSLFRLGQMHTTDLTRRLGTNYTNTLKHLVLLENEGLLEHRLSGTTRFFRFASGFKAQAVMKLLEEWDKT